MAGLASARSLSEPLLSLVRLRLSLETRESLNLALIGWIVLVLEVVSVIFADAHGVRFLDCLRLLPTATVVT